MPEDKEQDEELVREANLLTDLIVEKIAFVDEPADQDSQILVLKSQDGVEVESTNEDEAEEEQEGAEKAAGYISPSEIIISPSFSKHQQDENACFMDSWSLSVSTS